MYVVMRAAKMNLRSLICSFEVVDDDFKRMLYNILCCVNFMHSANILHRDIKPENILLTNSGELQICDFGLARTLPQSCQGKHNGNSIKVRKSVHRNLNSKLETEVPEPDFNGKIVSKLQKI